MTAARTRNLLIEITAMLIAGVALFSVALATAFVLAEVFEASLYPESLPVTRTEICFPASAATSL